jgi:protein-S-isoprenylcysteine O-methyltransferase Ste14
MHLTPLFFFGWFLTISGTLVRLQCYRLLGPLFTFDIGIQEKHKLITSGPYAYVRHPSYTGACCAVFGALMCYSMPGSWVYECTKADALVDTFAWVLLVETVIVVTILVRRAREEDEMLKQTFGKEWEEWARRVPANFIPGIY